MNCNDARPLLDLLFDSALETKDSALVLDHLKSCNECQRQWNDLEQLRAGFRNAKDQSPMPAGLMEKISTQLKTEERKQQKQFFARAIPVMAVAATVIAIGFFVLPLINQGHQNLQENQNLQEHQNPREHQQAITPATIHTASTDVLIDQLASKQALEPFANRNQLAEKVGYDLKLLQLPQWQMNKLSAYKSPATVPIARFDFVRKSAAGEQNLSCYQAPQGVISAKGADPQTIGGKHVLFGNHGKFQFALWSQNGRDYLFVTALSRRQLEAIVRGA